MNNPQRFASDLRFPLSDEEFENWRSQIVTSNSAAKMGLRRRPYAFTEQGVAMLSSVLNSDRAVEVKHRHHAGLRAAAKIMSTHFASRWYNERRMLPAIWRKTEFDSRSELIPEVQHLSAADKLKLIRVLTEELDTGEDISLFVPGKAYDILTPFASPGAVLGNLDEAFGKSCEQDQLWRGWA